MPSPKFHSQLLAIPPGTELPIKLDLQRKCAGAGIRGKADQDGLERHALDQRRYAVDPDRQAIGGQQRAGGQITISTNTSLSSTGSFSGPLTPTSWA